MEDNNAILFDGVRTKLSTEEVHRNLSFSVRRGDVVCLLGPSGCGKTTALRIAAGLLIAYQGTALIEGQRPEDAWPRVAMVFQSPRLAYWRTALQNVMLALELRMSHLSRSEMEERALHYLDAVGLARDGYKYPSSLSGGEQHRVALVRALVVEPHILLMDEPFSDLDVSTKNRLWDQTLQLCEETGRTILMVTHDLNEALYLSNRVFVLSDKPSTVKMDLRVDVPRPRDVTGPAMGGLRGLLREALDENVRYGSVVA